VSARTSGLIPIASIRATTPIWCAAGMDTVTMRIFVFARPAGSVRIATSSAIQWSHAMATAFAALTGRGASATRTNTAARSMPVNFARIISCRAPPRAH